MELRKTIEERHSYRCYLPTAISDDTVKKIVDAARLGPSSKNAQQ